DAEGQVIERKIELPRDKQAQLDTIALLSGNLARDEAGGVLAELRAEQNDEATLPEERALPEAPPLPPSDDERATGLAATKVPGATEAPETPKKEPQNPKKAAPGGARVK